MESYKLIKSSALACGAIAAALSASASTDYGPALWKPTCNANYYTSGYGHKFCVIHDMEGYYLSTVSYLISCSHTSSSVFYAVNGLTDSSDGGALPGEITQMVRESYYAWHAICWNQYSFGTEHEGFESNPAWYTDAMYRASGGLQAHLCNAYGIAKDRNHIVAHGEKSNANWVSYCNANFGCSATCNTHTDPGAYWNWTTFMNYIKGVTPPVTHVVGDFNGDKKTEYATWRPSDGTWRVNGIGNTQYGASGDIPVPGDYDGDGITEYAVYRPSNGTWYVCGLGNTQYGTNTDIPVPGDYNGDGKTEYAVFRPSNCTWYINGIGNTQYGVTGDIPVPGDYTGSGKTQIAVFRPSNGTWYVYGVGQTQYGTSGDIPVPADYNGDGKTEYAVFRPSNGTWYVNGIGNTQYGTSGDIPAPGDYNGDGKAEYAIWRPSDGTWRVNGIGNTQYGASGDIPCPSPYCIRYFFFGY